MKRFFLTLWFFSIALGAGFAQKPNLPPCGRRCWFLPSGWQRICPIRSCG